MTRTVDDVRAYLRTQVNNALRRLGMYGDEVSLMLLFDALAYTESIESEWAAERDALRQRGKFVSTGVGGAMESVLPDIGRGVSAIALVYAEFAHRAGWSERNNWKYPNLGHLPLGARQQRRGRALGDDGRRRHQPGWAMGCDRKLSALYLSPQ
jgi:hypothetical protein